MMRHFPLIATVLLIVGSVGCTQNNASARYQEEPYQASHPSSNQSYTSLDDMDSNQSASATYDYQSADSGATYAGNTTTSDQPVTMTVTGDEPVLDEPFAPEGGGVYVVQKKDTLYDLSRRFYGDQSRWREIWDANRNRVPNPDQLPVGIKLIIP